MNINVGRVTAVEHSSWALIKKAPEKMDSISDPAFLIAEQAAALSRARIDNELSVTAVKRALDEQKRHRSSHRRRRCEDL